jgi:hypothetical protein
MEQAAIPRDVDGHVHWNAHWTPHTNYLTDSKGQPTRYGLLPPDLRKLITDYKVWPAVALTRELGDSIYNLDRLLTEHNGKCPPRLNKRSLTLSIDQFKDAMLEPECKRLYEQRRRLRQHWQERCDGKWLVHGAPTYPFKSEIQSALRVDKFQIRLE